MIHPTFPDFKQGQRVAVRVPMDKYILRSGDLCYVVKQNHLQTTVEEARTGVHHTVQTLDLDPWTR